MGMVVVATLGSPACFILPCPLLLLVPVGLIGLLVSLVGLFFRPRWCGAVGLVVGVMCITAWVGFFWMALAPTLANMRQYDVTMAEHTMLLMRSQAAVEMIELRRWSDGSVPSTLEAAGVTGENLVDPWNRPLRYVLEPTTPRGYQLFTDGKDGIQGTNDDIELIGLPRRGFGLAPIRRSRRADSDEPRGSDDGG